MNHNFQYVSRKVVTQLIRNGTFPSLTFLTLLDYRLNLWGHRSSTASFSWYNYPCIDLFWQDEGFLELFLLLFGWVICFWSEKSFARMNELQDLSLHQPKELFYKLHWLLLSFDFYLWYRSRCPCFYVLMFYQVLHCNLRPIDDFDQNHKEYPCSYWQFSQELLFSSFLGSRT